MPSDLSQNPYQSLISEGSYLRLRFAEANFRPIATMPRQKRHKQDWEDGLKRNVNKGGKRRGWSVSEHNGKTCLRLQFPKTGDERPTNAQTNLPFA